MKKQHQLGDGERKGEEFKFTEPEFTNILVKWTFDAKMDFSPLSPATSYR